MSQFNNDPLADAERFDMIGGEADLQRSNNIFGREGTVFTPNGRTSTAYHRLTTGKLAEQQGWIEPQNDGFFKEWAQGTQRTISEFRRSVGNTLDNSKMESEADAWLKQRQHLNKPQNIGIMDPGWWGYTGGSATADSSVGLLAAAAATGISVASGGTGALPAFAAVFATTFMREFGDTQDEIEAATQGKLDPQSVFAAAMLSSFVKAGIEGGFGVEPLIAGMIGRKVVTKVATKTGGEALLKAYAKQASRGMWRWGKGLGGYAGAAVGEGMEEVLQRMTDDITLHELAGKDFSPWEDYFDDFITGTAGGLMLGIAGAFGGMASNTTKTTPEALTQPLTEDRILSFHNRLDADAAVIERQMTDARFAQWYDELIASGMPQEQAAHLATVMKTIAYNLAMQAGISPATFIDAFKTGFTPDMLADHDIKVIDGMKGDNRATLEYLQARFPTLKDVISSTLTAADAAKVKAQNAQEEAEKAKLEDEATQVIKEKLNRVFAGVEEAQAEEADRPRREAAGLPVGQALETDEDGNVRITLDEFDSAELLEIYTHGVETDRGRVMLDRKGRLVIVPETELPIIEVEEVEQEAELPEGEAERAAALEEIEKQSRSKIEAQNKSLRTALERVRRKEAGEIIGVLPGADTVFDKVKAERDARNKAAATERRQKRRQQAREKLEQEEADRAAAFAEEQARRQAAGEEALPQRQPLITPPDELAKIKAQEEAAGARRAAAFAEEQERRQAEGEAALPPQEPISDQYPPGSFPEDRTAPKGNTSILGQYFVEYNLAVFYGNADVATVLHEWMHHLVARGILKDSHGNALRNHFKQGDTWDEVGMEEMVDSFMVYLRDNKLPDAGHPVINAFKYIKGVLAKTHANTVDMIEQQSVASEQRMVQQIETKRILDKALAGLSLTGEQALQGDSLHIAMMLGGRGQADVVDEEAQLAADDEDAAPQAPILAEQRDAASDVDQLDYNALLNRLHGIFGSHEALKDAYPDESFARESMTEERLREIVQAEQAGSKQRQGKMRKLALEAFGVERYRDLEPKDRPYFKITFDALKKVKLGRRPKRGESYKADVREEIAALKEAMGKMPRTEELRETANGGPRLYQKARNAIRRFGRGARGEFTNFSYLLRFLDQSVQGGAWETVFGAKYEDGLARYSNTLNKLIGELLDIRVERGLEDLRWLDEQVDIDGQLYTKGTLIDYFNYARDPGSESLSALKQSNNLSDAFIAKAQAIVNSDAKMLAGADFFVDAYAKMYETLAPEYKAITGRDLPKIDFYIPRQREDTTYSDDDIVEQWINITPDQRQRRLARNSMLSERSKTAGDRIRVGKPLQVLTDYADAVATYVGKARNIIDMNMIINDPSVHKAIIDTYSQDSGVTGALQALVNREAHAGARVEPSGPIEQSINELRIRAQNSLLGFRPKTILRQPVSAFAALAEIPGFRIDQYLGQMLQISTHMSTQFNKAGAQHLLEGHEVYGLLKKYAPQILERSYDLEREDFTRRGFKGLGQLRVYDRFTKKSRTIGEIGHAGIASADMLTVSSVWMHAYKTALRELANKNETGADAEAKAGRFATRVVRNTQPPSLPFERNMWQTGNALKRAATVFTGQHMVLLQQWQYSVIAPLIKGTQQGAAQGGVLGGFGGFARSLITPVGEFGTTPIKKIALLGAIPSFAFGMIMRLRPPTREEWIRDLMIFPLMSIPVFGPIIMASLINGWRDADGESLWMQAGEALIQVAHDISEGEVDLRGKTGESLLESFALWSGFPSTVAETGRVIALHLTDKGKIDPKAVAADVVDAVGFTGIPVEE